MIAACIVRAMPAPSPTEFKSKPKPGIPAAAPVTPASNPAQRPEPFPVLQRPVASLWGVGPERAALLARLGIFSIQDLLLNRPRRYEDRRHFKRISDLQKGEAGTARGRIVAMGLKRFARGAKSVFEIVLDDGSAPLHCRWWNLPYMEKYFAREDEVFVFGRLIQTRPRTMDHPETEVIEGGEESFIHLARIVPVYSLTEGLPQRWRRGLAWRTLEQFQAHLNDSGPAPCEAPHLMRDTLVPPRESAIRMIHFPEELSDVEIARRRLALDEFVAFQRQIRARRKKFEANARALPC
ncbi:MAG TPA: hypothetical protein VGV18_07960, partial [Verrucomicrobiae bacterium]|nr:hypothetical protein [Verrucomicrobiae bacterium]